MGREAGTRYVLYIYQPSISYYFEQTDILEIKTNEQNNQVETDEALKLACEKNYCSPEEIRIIDVFETKDELENYLIQHDLRYLS
jgi:hypothetical protein